MRRKTSRHLPSRSKIRSATIPLFFLALVIAMMPAHADDRDLVRSSGGTPWVYLLLDSSGSMDETADPVDSKYWYEDSPTSKAYLAKQTIYSIVEDLNDSVKIGFNTFGQKNLRAWKKSWGFRADMTDDEIENLPWYSELEWPTHWTINGGDQRSEDTYDSCDNPHPDPGSSGGGGPGRVEPANSSYWDWVGELSSYNKWGPAGDQITKVAIKDYHIATVYLVTLHPPGQHLDDVMNWEGKVEVMNCNTGVTKEAMIRYKPAFATDLDGNPLPNTAYVSSMSSEDEDDPDDDPTCQSGWRENNEEQVKPGALGYPTFPDPASRSTIFDRGHNLPWDWKSFPDTTPGFKYSNRQELMRRLAPNVFASGSYDPTVQPEFRIGPYLQDYATDYYHIIKPETSETPPFGFTTLTPLGRSLAKFRGWHSQWKTQADLALGASAFECSPRYAILLTDGIDTCENDDPADVAADLLADGVRTFVIGYGDLENSDLQAIADAGGTGKDDTIQTDVEDCTHFSYSKPDPDNPGETITGDVCDVVARDTEALKNSLEAILGSLSSSRSSFAGAAAPTGQIEAEDVIYIPSFLPIAEQAEWKGSLAMFRRPMPFTDDTPPVPDVSELCVDDPAADPPTACLAWDAADSMMSQAATGDDIAGGDFRIGYTETTRRVFWNRSGATSLATPRQLGLLEPTQSGETFPTWARNRLWTRLGIPHNPFDPSDDAAADAKAQEILGSVLVTKVGTDAGGGSHEYILGDIFHSQPLHVGPPTRYDYMRANLYGSGDCWNGTTFDSTNKGYRCYWLRNKWRRHVAFVGSNDGQLHAFDAGRVRHNNADNEFDPSMTTGSGNELFAFVPTEIMRKYKDRYDGPLDHQWGVDGSLVQDDVFVVPSWNGVTALNSNNREWRTMVIGGMRRGGRGYFALDVTTPDPLTPDGTKGEVLPPDVASQGYIPGCLENQGAGCDSLAYPSLRWEFRDRVAGGAPADADGNGHRDLGYSWSTPVTGRVRLGSDGSGNDIYSFVAIFGGGMDPSDPGVGNFIYMVDIETGKVLYKEAVTAAVPSKVAALDVNRDAVLDLVYVGDVDGNLYKIDMTEDATRDANGKITDADWQPFVIFDSEGRPFYHPPTLIWSAKNNSHAVAIGTGDREDLWSAAAGTDALFVFMDTGFDNSLAAPYTQADLYTLGDDPETESILLEPPALSVLSGYALEFTSGERMISQVFALSGFLTFTTYNPALTASTVTGCGAAGTSNLYTIRTVNGNSLLSGGERYRSVNGYVSNPFSAPSASDGPTNGTTPTDSNPPDNYDDVIEYLKSQMPANCRFTNKRIDIKAVRSDTGMEWLAPVPVCVRRSNWKQF